MDRSVGPYQLGEMLGLLPFGELVEARHPARSEPLAIVLFHDELAKDHRFRGLLRLEVARAGGLRHPGIARPIEVGEHSGALYLVVERPAGAVTLASRQEAGPPLTREQTLALTRRLAEGLDAAHSRRIMHGALGPASVLVAADGAAALVGIGLLAAVNEAGHAALVTAQADAAYTAPEQRSGDLAAVTADGYALGVLAGSLLGERAAEIAAVLGRQRADAPAERFPTCTAFAMALADALAPAAVTDGPPVNAPAPAQTPERSRSPLPAPAQTPAPSVAPLPPPSPAAPEQAAPEIAATVTPSVETPALLPWNPPSPGVAASGPPAEAAPAEAHPPTPSVPATGSPGRGMPQWLRESIDPQGAAGPPSGASATRPIPHRQLPGDQRPSGRGRSRPAPPTVTRSRPTPAMLACLRTQEQTDLLTDGLLWVTDRVPMLDQLVDRYTRDGKIGPVPLGVAVAGALALLLLLLMQPAAASIFVVLVIGLYALPSIVAQLTASERQPPEAVRVTGTVSTHRRVGGLSWDQFELDIGDGLALSLSPSAYHRLCSIGEPITVDRPSVASGSERVTVAHELDGVTVTYLTPSRLLLDVRDPTGAVIHRHPQYAGEPGDTRAVPQSAQPHAPRPHRPATVRPDPTPRWRPTPHGHQIVVRMPPTVASDIAQAFKPVAIRAGVVNGAPLLLLLSSAVYGNYGFFALIATFGIFMLVGAGLLTRALQLWNALRATALVRVVAPIRLHHNQRAGSKGRRHDYFYLHLDDGTELKIQRPLYNRLARLGRQLDSGENPSFWESVAQQITQTEETVREYELDPVTVTYEPASELLLEILDREGAALFRDSAVRPVTLDGAPALTTE